MQKLASQKEQDRLGFAYFNVIAKNWFFQKARELVKKNKLESELQKDSDKDFTTESSFFVDSIEDGETRNEFWIEFYKSLDSWKPVLTKKTEKKVLEAVIFLMTHSDLVPIYNKKAIYMFLREITRFKF